MVVSGFAGQQRFQQASTAVAVLASSVGSGALRQEVQAKYDT